MSEPSDANDPSDELAPTEGAMVRVLEIVNQKGLTDALTKRDAPFGDYRTAEKQPSAPAS